MAELALGAKEEAQNTYASEEEDQGLGSLVNSIPTNKLLAAYCEVLYS